MGEWHEVKTRQWSPCDGCQMGSCSISQKEEGGKLYSKTDDCHEACQEYNDWVKNNLRHAMGGGILPKRLFSVSEYV